MTTAKLVKAIEKVGGKVQAREHGTFSVVMGSRAGSWYDQNGSATCARVRRIDDRDDAMSDYFAGSFYRTIKSFVGALTK